MRHSRSNARSSPFSLIGPSAVGMLAWLGGKRKLLEASSQRGRTLANHGAPSREYVDSGLPVSSDLQEPLRSRQIPKQHKHQTTSRGQHMMPGSTTSQRAHKRQRRDHFTTKQPASIDMVMVMGHAQANNLTANLDVQQLEAPSNAACTGSSIAVTTDAAAPEMPRQTSASCAATTANGMTLTPAAMPARQTPAGAAAQRPGHSAKQSTGALPQQAGAPSVQVSSRVPGRTPQAVVPCDHHHIGPSRSANDCLQLGPAVTHAQLTSSQAIGGYGVLQAAKQTKPASLDLLFLTGARTST